MSQTPVAAPEFHPEWDAAAKETYERLLGQATRFEEALGFSGDTLLEGDIKLFASLYAGKVGELREKVDALGKSIAALS